MKICEKRSDLLKAEGNLLVLGGPGSGKTTIALLKANKIIVENQLKPFQKILFLSFARATIAQIDKATKSLIDADARKLIEINTYHGFIWKLLQNYSYLLINHRKITLLTPHLGAARLAELDDDQTKFEKQEQLFADEGLLSFDIFAKTAGTLLQQSQRVLKLITDTYPIIIVDEFQDTDGFEWDFIKTLASHSTIIALADPEQRIYDFRGASVDRIKEYLEYCKPTPFDFEQENNRSTGKDIATFGNDLLLGKNKGKTYNDVAITKYTYNDAEQYKMLKVTIIQAIKRLRETSDWSIAILVRSKKMMFRVSSYLSTKTSLPEIRHEVALDPNGPALAGLVIAGLLEPPELNQRERTVADVINHIRGQSGDKISLANLRFTNALTKFLETGQTPTGKNRVLFFSELDEIIEKRKLTILIGVPEADWLTVRALFQACSSPYLKNIYEDARFLRLLNKGAVLSERLAQTWRSSQTYVGAKLAIEDALLQEHFVATQKAFKGIHVMTLHKSKGKEFDEVIIWEDYYTPLVHPESDDKQISDARYLLRVGATRARKKTTFLTVATKPCILL